MHWAVTSLASGVLDHVTRNSIINDTLEWEDAPGILSPSVAGLRNERQEASVDVVRNLDVPLAVFGTDDRLVEEAEATLPEYYILLSLVG